MFKTINTRCHKYDESGILLRQGRRVLKALCVLPDGRESNVVCREFLVQWAPSESDEESLEDEAIHTALTESRELRSNGSYRGSSRGSMHLAETNRTVGNDFITRRIQTGQNLPTTNKMTVNPRMINSTKMNATSGPLNGQFGTGFQ